MRKILIGLTIAISCFFSTAFAADYARQVKVVINFTDKKENPYLAVEGIYMNCYGNIVGCQPDGNFLYYKSELDGVTTIANQPPGGNIPGNGVIPTYFADVNTSYPPSAPYSKYYFQLYPDDIGNIKTLNYNLALVTCDGSSYSSNFQNCKVVFS